MDQLAIVFWDCANMFHDSTTIHYVDHKPKSEDLTWAEGKSIAELFQDAGISVQRAMEVFPETIVPGMEHLIYNNDGTSHYREDLSWKFGFRQISLPMGPEGIKKLSELVKKRPIHVFLNQEGRARNPAETRFLFSVEAD